MEILAHPWQLAVLGFIAGFLLARWIYRHDGPAKPSPNPDISEAQIEAALRANDKVGAIRLYRQRTGAGLKDAQRAVAILAKRMHA